MRKPSKSVLRCQIIKIIADFPFNSSLLNCCHLREYWLGCSQVWNKTQNYSTKLLLNATLLPTWPGEHYNWSAHCINSPWYRPQKASIGHRKWAPWKKSSILYASRFHEWKHVHTHKCKGSEFEGFFLCWSYEWKCLDEWESSISRQEVEWFKEIEIKFAGNMCGEMTTSFEEFFCFVGARE